MSYAKLRHCLEEKRILLSKYLGLAESLRTRLDSRDAWGLASVLAEREVLIQKINRLNEEIRGIGAETFLEEKRGTPELEEGARSVSSGIEALLQQTKIIDQQCEDRLAAWRDEVKGELQRIRKDSKAVRQYRRGHFFQPKFLDVRK
jgi:hypothetical protein